ncbi:penicillin-binding protein 2 [Candidatus Giovannonibacteria bacterium]|nr:penicillin-binding protein 2 [Candidatus Giovannonibacteria bacterium]
MSPLHSQNKDLEPDEIFMDSKNLPGFERERFEGRLEFPISSQVNAYLGLLLILIFGLFFYRIYNLQILSGAVLKARAEDNRLKILPLWPERGRILDHNGALLAGNDTSFRLLLDGTRMAEPEKIAKLTKLLNGIEEKTKISFDRDNINKDVLANKEDIILAEFSDWQALESLRKEYYLDLPLKLEPFLSRSYPLREAASHLVGYMGKSSADEVLRLKSFEVNKLVGRSGIEQAYDSYLSGNSGSKLTEVDSKGDIFSEIVQKIPESGNDVYLSIDAGLQKRVYKDMKAIIDDRGFRGGGAVVMDPNNGEILSMVSYPGFDPNLFTSGGPKKEIDAVLTSMAKPLFNRTVSGLYSSGSIIKPLYALAALEEGIISPEKEILSTGKLVVPNPFNPKEPSIFFDWKVHGWVDMRKAIAVSSNVYFFTVGGGFGDIKGLGVSKMRDWLTKFGFGQKTNVDVLGEKEGFIPSPEWKASTQKDDPIWRVGDTYNLSIGQGSFQVTPVQMAVFASIIANGGKILEPHVFKEVRKGEEVIFSANPKIKKTLSISENNLKVIKEGMNLGTKIGTASILAGLKLEVAAKTGTAEIGQNKKNVNSWFIGFFPYDKPTIAMAVVLEGGVYTNTVGATAAARQMIEWIDIYRPDLLNTSQE